MPIIQSQALNENFVISHIFGIIKFNDHSQKLINGDVIFPFFQCSTASQIFHVLFAIE